MRVIQTIAGTRLDHGGTSRSVPALCDALVKLGIDNHLLTAEPADSRIACNYPQDRSRVLLTRESKWFRQWGISRQFQSGLQRLVGSDRNAVVHDHAVWLASNHAVAKFCRRHGIARVVSPRGMLGTWALGNGRWKKRLAWLLYQRKDIVSATGFHATSEQEACEVRALGFKQPIAVVPNGLDVPAELPKRKETGFRQALFLSRIHPKKGLLQLVRAWQAAGVSQEWRLCIAGPDENGHQREVEALVEQLGLQKQIGFVGAYDDSAKWQAYVNADLFVLPSFNENFGIVIAEAMAAGLPVLTTTGTPWSVLKENQMGWWVDASVEALTAALIEATTRPQPTLVAMGQLASEHVRRTYSWQETASKLSEFYSELYKVPRKKAW